MRKSSEIVQGVKFCRGNKNNVRGFRLERFKKLIGIGDSVFYTNLIKLSVPVVMQQGMAALLFLVDNIMVGKLGEVPIAALGLANQLSFLMQAFTFGVNSAASIFVGQFWGKRDVKSIRKTQGMALACATVIAFVFFSIAQFAPGLVFKAFHATPEVMELGTQYLRIVSWGYIFQCVSQVFSIILRSCKQAVLPMISTGAGVLVNATLNYVLIFGKLGFPAMGVQGAAIATFIAIISDFLIITIMSYTKKSVTAAKVKEWRFDFEGFKKFIKMGFPVFLNEIFWSVGTVMYTVLYGIMGMQAVAVMQVFNVIDRISFVVFIGLGSSSGVLIGNKIGEGKPKVAQLYARRMLVVGPMVGIIVGICVVLLSHWFLQFFNLTPETRASVLSVLKVFACMCWVYVLNFMIIMGTLRPGGDTVHCSYLEILPLWLVSIPMTFFAGIVLKAPLWLVYLFILPGELVKAIMGIKRVRSARWINDVTVE